LNGQELLGSGTYRRNKIKTILDLAADVPHFLPAVLDEGELRNGSLYKVESEQNMRIMELGCSSGGYDICLKSNVSNGGCCRWSALTLRGADHCWQLVTQRRRWLTLCRRLSRP
jgi:hypothetical protein